MVKVTPAPVVKPTPTSLTSATASAGCHSGVDGPREPDLEEVGELVVKKIRRPVHHKDSQRSDAKGGKNQS